MRARDLNLMVIDKDERIAVLEAALRKIEKLALRGMSKMDGQEIDSEYDGLELSRIYSVSESTLRAE